MIIRINFKTGRSSPNSKWCRHVYGQFDNVESLVETSSYAYLCKINIEVGQPDKDVIISVLQFLYRRREAVDVERHHVAQAPAELTLSTIQLHLTSQLLR